MLRCISTRISAVGEPPLAKRNLSSRVEREVGAVLGQRPRARVCGLIVSASLRPAARPKTTRSIRLFEPSRLAPWTETQAASPTANRPGTTLSGSPSLMVTTSP